MNSLKCLPGVGPKSAQRMALHLLERDREGAAKLAVDLQKAADGVTRCKRCRTLTEEELCGTCRNPRRENETLCVVETPADILAIEQAGTYQGKYFVLMGHLSPIDGIGPDDIGISELMQLLKDEEISEIILATNPTVEGEATAHFISEKAKAHGVHVSRIAHGVPLGGELEYIDGGTLALAFASRRTL
jgi:recombination protein RecR